MMDDALRGQRSRRFLVFISAVLGWSSCFFCQRTLPSSIGYMTAGFGQETSTSGNQRRTESWELNELVLTKEEYGQLQNLFVIAYSTSILISGFLSDYINPKILFYLSIGMSGILCTIFPLTIGNTLLCSIVWFCFGIFEGCGWLATAKIVKQMYTPIELGMWWSFLSCASNITASISPLFISYIVSCSGWQTGFYITGLNSMFFLLPVAMIMRFDGDTTPKPRPRSTLGHRWYHVFFVPRLQFVIVIYIILWVAKSSVNNWALLYLHEVYQQLPRKALAVSLLQFGGVVGKLVVGNLSTLLIQRELTKRTSLLCITMSLVALLVFMLGTESFKNQSEVDALLLMFFLGFVIDGSVVLANLEAMETVPDSLSGSALGLATFSSQFVGRSLGAGYAFSYLQQSYGWTTVYQGVAMLCTGAATLGGYLIIFILY